MSAPSNVREHFMIYREVDKGGRVVKKYLFRSWTVGARWTWRENRIGAARFYSEHEASGYARRWPDAKIDHRYPPEVSA